MRKYQLHDPGNQSYEMKFSDDQNDMGTAFILLSITIIMFLGGPVKTKDKAKTKASPTPTKSQNFFECVVDLLMFFCFKDFI